MICTSRYVSDVSHYIFRLKNALLKPQHCWHERKKTNIQSSQTGSKYHANTARTLSCLTLSPHVHITSHNYILITLNNNKPRRQIWQLFDRRGVCASECKQRVSHAENAHVATTKLHTSTSTAATTYKLYGLIGLQSYWTSKQKMSGETQPTCTTMCGPALVHFEDGAAKH